MKYFVIYIAISTMLSCNKAIMPKSDKIENISEMIVYYYDVDDKLRKDTITMTSEKLSSFIKIMSKSQPTTESPPKVKDFTLKFDVKYTDHDLEHFRISVYGGMNNSYITISDDGEFMRIVTGNYTNSELAIFLTGYLQNLGIEI